VNSGWRPPQPSGYLESIQAVGGFAAPLLAGASFALAVLGLQAAATPATAYSRWPDASLAFFIAAGLAQIGAVQATAWTRRYMCTPDELAQWYPERLVNGTPSQWLYNVQRSQMRQALRWANVARGFFHAGMVALLAGLFAACVPPNHISSGRWVVLAVVVVGILGESAWLIRASFLDRALRRRAWVHALVLVAAVGALIAGFTDMLRVLAAAFVLAGALAYALAGRRNQPRPGDPGAGPGQGPPTDQVRSRWRRWHRVVLLIAGGCAAAGAIVLAAADLAVVVTITLLPSILVAVGCLADLARQERILRQA